MSIELFIGVLTMLTNLETSISMAREKLENYLDDLGAIFEISSGYVNFDFNEDGDYEVKMDFANLSEEVSEVIVHIDGSFLHASSMGELAIELENLYNYMNIFHYGIVISNLSMTPSKHNLEISSWSNFCEELEKYEEMNFGELNPTQEQQARFNNYLDDISEVGEQTSGTKFTKLLEDMFV